MQCWPEIMKVLQVTELIILAIVFTEENLSQLYSETSIKWPPN